MCETGAGQTCTRILPSSCVCFSLFVCCDLKRKTALTDCSSLLSRHLHAQGTSVHAGRRSTRSQPLLQELPRIRGREEEALGRRCASSAPKQHSPVQAILCHWDRLPDAKMLATRRQKLTPEPPYGHRAHLACLFSLSLSFLLFLFFFCPFNGEEKRCRDF